MFAQFAEALPNVVGNELGSKVVNTVTNTATTEAVKLAGNPLFLVGGIALIVIALLIFLMLKKIILNTVLGIVGWVVVVLILKIELPWAVSFLISAVFGLGGLGTIMLLKFFGIL